MDSSTLALGRNRNSSHLTIKPKTMTIGRELVDLQWETGEDEVEKLGMKTTKIHCIDV